MSGGWISAEAFRAIEGEGTTAFRIRSGGTVVVERFGGAALVSMDAGGDDAQIAAEVLSFARDVGWECLRVFVRQMVCSPGADDRPRLVAGDGVGTVERVREGGLTYEVDFAAGYSVGLFCDQRANRASLRSRKVRRLLNTFAHTCAFSVAAAAAGAVTTSVDVSKACLERGRRNFELNGIATAGHRFVTEDVGVYVGRLARRGERFDAIVLDPPTFGRGGGRRTFRIEKDFAGLVRAAGEICESGGVILLSTNFRAWGPAQLEGIGRANLPSGTEFERASPQPDFRPGKGAASLWALLP